LCLKRYRPDLTVTVADSPPTGIGVIMGLDPSSLALDDRYSELCDNYIDLDYSTLGNDKEERLNLVPGTWPSVEKLLPGVASQSRW
jgi:hypothetical protein